MNEQGLSQQSMQAMMFQANNIGTGMNKGMGLAGYLEALPDDTLSMQELGAYVYGTPEAYKAAQLREWQASVDKPLYDASIDILGPVGAGLASSTAKAARVASNYVKNLQAIPKKSNIASGRIADESRRNALKLGGASVAAAPAAVNTLTKVLAPSLTNKAVSTVVNKAVGTTAKANQAARSHRFGVHPEIDKVLEAKKKYTMDTYGVPTIELGKYKKLLEEDVKVGKYTKEVADKKVAKVKEVVRDNRALIQKDQELSKFGDEIESIRREVVGKSTRADNVADDVRTLIELK